MSYIINNEIKYSNSPNLDIFGRLRASEPFTLFNSDLTQSSGYTDWETVLFNSGTSVWNSNKSEKELNVFGSGDRVIIQQHGYNFYQPGKSQLVILTGIFGSGVSGVTKNMGYFDHFNGLFFQLSGSTFGVTLRTNTSGSSIDTFIPQSDWNIDTLNTGSTLNPSGKHLDVSKTNIYIINFQWLGVGRVIFALNIDGVITPVHQILNANNKTEVYMRTANLPVRYEIESTGGVDSTFRQICSTVISEGGQENKGRILTVSNVLTTKNINSRKSILSIRLSSIFNGITNRHKIKPVKVEILTTTNSVNAYWELVLQRGYLGENNLGGSPTWSSLPGNEAIEYSVNGTTVTGGRTIDSGFVFTTTQTGDKVSASVTEGKDVLSLNYSGDTSDWLHLVVTPNLSSNWTSSITLKIED